MRVFLLVLLAAISGLLANILAGPVNERWGLSLPGRIEITIGAFLITLLLTVLLEAGLRLPGRIAVHRFFYLQLLTRADMIRRWRTRFAPLHLGRGPRYVEAAEVLNQGDRRELVVFLKEALLDSKRSARHLLILGEPGSGKTTALEKVCLDLASQSLRTLGLRGPVPILVRAGDHRHDDDLSGMIADALRRSTKGRTRRFLTEPRIVDSLLESRRTILLVDALDELSGDRRDAVLNVVAGAAQNPAFQRLSIVVTCRTRQDPGSALPGFGTYTILALSDDAVDRFIAAYAKDRGTHPSTIGHRLRAGGFLDAGGLGRNPFWLTKLIEIGVEESVRSQVLKLACNQALTKELEKPESVKRKWTRPSGIGETEYAAECELALASLALAMNARRACRLDEARATVGAWLVGRGRVVAGLEVTPDHVLELSRDAGLLDGNPDPVGFGHRIVQEFFTARGLLQTETLDGPRLAALAVDPALWPTLSMYAGMMPEGQGDALIRSLLAVEPHATGLACALATCVGDDPAKFVGIGQDLYTALRSTLASDESLDSQLEKSLRDFLTVGFNSAAHFLGFLTTDHDPSIRRRACQLLAMSEAPEAVRILAFVGLADSDATIQQAAADVLVEMGAVRSGWPLIRQLFSADARTQRTATEALSRLAMPEAVNYLVEAEIDDDVAATALARCGAHGIGRLLIGLATGGRRERLRCAKALGEFGDPRVLRALESAVSDRSHDVMGAAARALLRLRRRSTPDGSAEDRDFLLTLLESSLDGDDETRAQTALMVLLEHRTPQTTEYLCRLSRDPQRFARVWEMDQETVLSELSARTEWPAATEALTAAFNRLRQEPATRGGRRLSRRVIDMLARSPHASAEDTLVTALEGNAGDLMETIIDGLASRSLGSRAASALMHCTKHPEPAIRGAAVRALGTIKSAEATRAMIETLADPVEYVRDETAEALAHMPDLTNHLQQAGVADVERVVGLVRVASARRERLLSSVSGQGPEPTPEELADQQATQAHMLQEMRDGTRLERLSAIRSTSMYKAEAVTRALLDPLLDPGHVTWHLPDEEDGESRTYRLRFGPHRSPPEADEISIEDALVSEVALRTDPTIVPALTAALADSNPKTRRRAARTIAARLGAIEFDGKGAFEPAALAPGDAALVIERALTLVSDVDRSTRKAAIAALASPRIEGGHIRLLSTVRSLGSSPDPLHRMFALQAVAGLVRARGQNLPDGADLARLMVRGFSDPEDAVREEAHALTETLPVAWFAFLDELWHRPLGPQAPMDLLELLVRCPQPAQTLFVEQAIRTGEAKSRTLACLAAGVAGDGRLTSTLLDAAAELDDIVTNELSDERLSEFDAASLTLEQLRFLVERSLRILGPEAWPAAREALVGPAGSLVKIEAAAHLLGRSSDASEFTTRRLAQLIRHRAVGISEASARAIRELGELAAPMLASEILAGSTESRTLAEILTRVMEGYPLPPSATVARRWAGSGELESVDDAPAESPSKMPFADHLQEMLVRIARSLFVGVAAGFVAWWWNEPLLTGIAVLYGVDTAVVRAHLPPAPFATENVVIVVMALCSLPSVILEAWLFISAGLHAQEIRRVRPFFYGLVIIAIGAPVVVAVVSRVIQNTDHPLLAGIDPIWLTNRLVVAGLLITVIAPGLISLWRWLARLVKAARLLVLAGGAEAETEEAYRQVTRTAVVVTAVELLTLLTFAPLHVSGALLLAFLTMGFAFPPIFSKLSLRGVRLVRWGAAAVGTDVITDISIIVLGLVTLASPSIPMYLWCTWFGRDGCTAPPGLVLALVIALIGGRLLGGVIALVVASLSERASTRLHIRRKIAARSILLSAAVGLVGVVSSLVLRGLASTSTLSPATQFWVSLKCVQVTVVVVIVVATLRSMQTSRSRQPQESQFLGLGVLAFTWLLVCPVFVFITLFSVFALVFIVVTSSRVVLHIFSPRSIQPMAREFRSASAEFARRFSSNWSRDE